MKVFKPKDINKCPDCGFTTTSYNDFLEHRVKCLRERRMKQEFHGALATYYWNKPS